MEGTTREVPPQVADSEGAEGAAEAPLGPSATLEDPPTTHVPREEEAAVSVKFDRPITPADEPPIPEEPSECAADAPDEPDAVRPAEAEQADRALAADAGGATKTGSAQEKRRSTWSSVSSTARWCVMQAPRPTPARAHAPHITSLRPLARVERTPCARISSRGLPRAKARGEHGLEDREFLGDAGEQTQERTASTTKAEARSGATFRRRSSA